MEARKNQPEEETVSTASWMVTFSDLITLLLTFFVLIICIANLDPQVLENAFGLSRPDGGNGVLDYGGGRPGAQLDSFLENLMEMPEDQQLPDDLKYALFQLTPPEEGAPESFQSPEEFPDPAKALEYNQALAGVEISRKERGLVIKWDGGIIFPEGLDLVQPSQAELLRSLAPILRELAWPISIEAYADPDSTLEGGQSPAAFDLAFRRAKAVLDIFLDLGLPPELFRLGGLAASQPQPTADSGAPPLPAARRQLEIVLFRPGPAGF